jgi:hypothetical protein
MPARCWNCAPASAWASTRRLGRIEGGRWADGQQPLHLGGAIDADAADKAARFMQLCSAHGLPIVSLVDTPGFMVGPAIEETCAGAAREPHVRRRRAPAGAAVRRGAAQGLRPGRDGDGGRRIPCAGGHRGLAERRVRRHGAGRRGALGYRKELEAMPEGARTRGAVSSSWWRGSTRPDRR